MAATTGKRPSSIGVDDGDIGTPPEKKFKTTPKGNSNDNPAVFSDSVRRKLQSTSRTGQACDRCKERKMRCDPDPLGCGPCKQKNLPCVTTDRISGRPSERGHIERLEGEIRVLRQQLAAYGSRYGPMDGVDFTQVQSSQTAASPSYPASNGYGSESSHGPPDMRLLADFMNAGQADSGANGPHPGPIRGTKVDVMGEEVDIADFDCPEMDEPKVPLPEGQYQFNNSRLSFLNTIMGHAKPPIPALPDKETAVTYAKYYNQAVGPYAPILHCPSFMRLVDNMYEKDFQPSAAEKVMFFVVMAIITHQLAVRNPSMAKSEFDKSNKYFHYSLSFFSALLRDPRLPSIQAMAMLLVHSRNLPKPGYSWSLSKMVLSRCVEMNMHRSHRSLKLPKSQQFNPLEIELRKRIFWVVLKKIVTSGVKLGRPMPMDMSDMDIEFPEALLDSEISERGIAEHRSGRCNYWIGLHIIRQTPLWMELYNRIIKVRRAPLEYVQIVEALDARVLEWKAQCDRDFSREPDDGSTQVARHFVETWFAEYRLLLHHPSLATTMSTDFAERNLEVCHQSALSLFRGVLTLFEKFKGADFTWHSTVSYVLAAGMSIEYYSQRKPHTQDSFKEMQHELQDWLKIMKIAGAVLGSGDQLVKFFKPFCDKVLKDSQSVLIASTALQNGVHSESRHAHPPLHPPLYPPSSRHAETGHVPDNRQSSAYQTDNSPALGRASSQGPQVSSYMSRYDPVRSSPLSSSSTNGTSNAISPYSTSSNPYHAAPPQPQSSSNSVMFQAVNMPPYTGSNPNSVPITREQPLSTTSASHPSLMDFSQANIGMSFGFDDTSVAGMWPTIIFQNGM